MDLVSDRYRRDFPHVPERIAGLVDLAYNLWWSWNPASTTVFSRLNSQAWVESIHNPVRMLADLPAEVLIEASKNPRYLRHYDIVMSRFRQELSQKNSWYTEHFSENGKSTIAYFSAEYGLHHSLPFYAGGLGFLAGDHLKQSSDLGLPLVALGFMYSEGYLHQHIGNDGMQENIREQLNRDAAPIKRVMYNHDDQLVVRVPFIDPPVYVAVWRVDIGAIPLYLLDTDIPENDPANRVISYRLYTGDHEQRLRQELVLGIGGSYVLDILGIRPTIIHVNEGHPAFALFERIREKVSGGMSFESAADYVRKTSVFTTHTPVPAGQDTFLHTLMDKYFSRYYPLLGADRRAILDLGNAPHDPPGLFNMTAFALRLCGFRNGVSKRHGEVARRMWGGLFPRVDDGSVPIRHITNGVHVPTWLDPRMQLLLNKYFSPYCPRWRTESDSPLVWEMIDEIPDEELWAVHMQLKRKLMNRIREQKRRKWVNEGTDPVNIVSGGALMDPGALTLGFARRFSTYKRADLIFRNPERFRRIVNNRWRPVQIIFAGKAHPDDYEGKQLIRKIFGYSHRQDFGGRVAFVEDYGEQMAQHLVHGVDVWLNNPLPPHEACGTSGMKAAVNGVLHLSVLDGWWVEGYNGINGWAIGNAAGGKDRDSDDARQLYDIIEREIVPLYYTVSPDGFPHMWVKKMKEAIRSTAPWFSARRMLKEYIRQAYDPALSFAKEQK
jgi:starch phosphorylase